MTSFRRALTGILLSLALTGAGHGDEVLARYEWTYGQWKKMPEQAALVIAQAWATGFEYATEKPVFCSSLATAIRDNGPASLATLLNDWPVLIETHNKNASNDAKRPLPSPSELDDLFISEVFALIIFDYCDFRGEMSWRGAVK